MNTHRHPVNKALHDNRSRTDHAVTRFVNFFGSLQFIGWQTLIIIIWVILNVTAFIRHWDPYPFILLNLLFSTQAAYAAPLILLAQNRQEQRDHLKMEHDYQVNENSLTEIQATRELIHEVHLTTVKVHAINLQQMTELEGLKHISAELNIIRQALAPAAPNPAAGTDLARQDPPPAQQEPPPAPRKTARKAAPRKDTP
jgi:uncharacterized membrane protein